MLRLGLHFVGWWILDCGRLGWVAFGQLIFWISRLTLGVIVLDFLGVGYVFDLIMGGVA